MKTTLVSPCRRLRTLGLALICSGLAGTLSAAPAATAPCGAKCSTLIAQADGVAPPPPTPGAEVPATEVGKSRGIFLALLAQQVMPGIASSLGDWFNRKLTGREPAPMQPLPALPITGNTAMQAGVAYQVSVVGRDGSRQLVDTSHRVFDTGERVEVSYRTNLPGLIEIFNIDSAGQESLIDRQLLSATQLATLGPYEFVNRKGEEILRITLRPCLPGDAGSGTRGMARAQVSPDLAGALLACDDPLMRQAGYSARGIAKVAMEGGTAFALDPISRSEIESGRLAPREVRIRFMHN